MSTFKDLFSGHAARYSEFRPTYPEELFRFIHASSKGHSAVWDCATGNGQAARNLVRFFDRVIATDASKEQIASATPQSGIEYSVQPAEKTNLEDHSIDAITVAQAFHWFDFERFFQEAKRVLKPGGLLVIWGYANCRIEPRLDAIIKKFYVDTVGPYWPPERRLVEEGYASIEFPFRGFPGPHMDIEQAMDAENFLGYVRTWSSVQKYIKEKQTDPVLEIESEIKRHWGNERVVRWPIFIRAGYM